MSSHTIRFRGFKTGSDSRNAVQPNRVKLTRAEKHIPNSKLIHQKEVEKTPELKPDISETKTKYSLPTAKDEKELKKWCTVASNRAMSDEVNPY